ncbi:MAG: RND family transporter, partial [Acidobacteriota bacterium]
MSYLQNMRKSILEAVATLCCRLPGTMLVLMILLTVLAGYGITLLHLETNLADYLPEDSPVVRRFTRAIEHYGSSDQLVIVIEGSEADTDVREFLADEVAAGLKESGQVLSVEYRFGGSLPDASSPLLDHALLYLDDGSLEKLVTMMTPEAIHRRVQANIALLRSPASLLAKELVAKDPLGLRDLYIGQFRKLVGNLDLRLLDGYAFSADLSHLVMLVKPVKPAQDLAFTEAFLGQVHDILERAKASVGAEEQKSLAGIHFGLTGAYPIMAEYNSFLRKDLAWSIVTAFIGVLVLFLIAFRRIGSLLYVGFPLLVELIWTMGFAGYTVGHLNLFTGAAAAILMGLAIDFSIHLFNRYVSERDRGKSLDEAIRLSLVETGDGVLTAAMTTVAAFAACGVTGIEGLAQLGLICGAGMIFGVVSTFVLMPVLLKLRGGRRHREEYRDSSFNFGLGAVAKFVAHHPRAVMLAWAALAVIFTWGSLKTRVDTDMRALRPKSSPTIELQKRLAQEIGSTLIYSMVMVEAPSDAKALELNQQVAQRLDKLVESGDVIFYLSLSSVMPSPSRQQKVLEWLTRERQAHPAGLDPDRISRDLAAALEEQGFRLGKEYRETVDLLHRALGVKDVLTLAALRKTALGERASRFMWKGNGETELVTYVYPRTTSTSRQYQVVDLLEEKVAGGLPGVNTIGVASLGRELKRLVKEGAIEATALAMGLVLILLWIHFRRLLYVVLTAVPLILGEMGAIGGMSLLGIHLNLVNMGVVPIILGIGIDDGIHILHRFLGQGRQDIEGVFRFAGRAVVITSLTTIVGFGSLVFASYRGPWTAG